jgi:epoxyqueuosine reductase QueG
MNKEFLRLYLVECGATLVGVGDVAAALPADIRHLDSAIAIAVSRGLNADTVSLLAGLQRIVERRLRERGYRYLSIPADSDRRKDKFVSRLYGLFSHKTAATCAGLGWVGKSGLIINRDFGPKLSWATVLTDAPFEPDEPIVHSRCGDCDLCVRHCPSGAIAGREWDVSEPYSQVVSYEKCRSLKLGRRLFAEKPNCGLCVSICPFARQRTVSREGGKNMARIAGGQGK